MYLEALKMSGYYRLPCTACSSENDISDIVCSNCGIVIEAPINVKRATLPVELSALGKRYKHVVEQTVLQGLWNERGLLENTVTAHGKAVLNTSFDFLWEWLIRGSLYESYRRQLLNKSRLAAAFENDIKRSTVDSILFGSEIDVVFAALSVDESGLGSYGDVTVVLKTGSIEKRTSALETNSFFFIESLQKTGWTIDRPVPPGHMCQWSDNFELVACKLSPVLKKGMKTEEFSKLILTSQGSRSTDEFIELHIYGKIASGTVEKIKIPLSLTKKFEPRQLLQLKEMSKRYNVEVYS